jgi:energy-coupling factor transport system ATP-binding protein
LRNRELRAQKLNRGQAQAWEMNANARAAGLLNQMGMADLAAVYPRDLSVGQRQWVALAAIMVAGPRILMLDEPTRGLDPAAKLRLAELLRGWRAAGHALLLVTHDVELAARLADRIALLEAGRLIANGQPLDVFSAHPPFAPQILQLYPRAGCLTPEQLFARLRSER